MNLRSRGQRRFLAECAITAGLAILWLGCLAWEWGASGRRPPSPTSG